MPETQQQIKDRLLKSASTLWNHKGTLPEGSFDPVVGILLGACATELEKISHDIDDTRGRTVERLVQLLYPEVLAGAIPAHGVAFAYPSEKQTTLLANTQFYHATKIEGTGNGSSSATKQLYFSPTGPFPLQQSAVALMATTQQVYLMREGIQKEAVATAPSRTYNPYSNTVWLGIENPEHLTAETFFYIELRHEAGKTLFYEALPSARWQQHGRVLEAQCRYPDGVQVHGQPDPAAIVSGRTSTMNRALKHINKFYAPRFIQVLGLDPNCGPTGWPEELAQVYTDNDFKQLKKDKLAWVRIDFPENIYMAGVADDLLISLNCFPVVNRQLMTTQHKLMDYVNILPLSSDGFFLDLDEITNMEGQALHGQNKQDSDSLFNIHYGGVGRFSEKDAMASVEGLIQLLRDESSAFSSMGNDFLGNELRSIQQSLNKLEQQLAEHHLLKADTPYLLIPDKERAGTGNIYVRYWSTNGAAGNHIKAGTALSLYKSADIRGNSVKLMTVTTGGRNSLNQQDKVLAYKTALLNKEKLVTREDIATFCRLKLALREAAVEVTQGYQVQNNTKGGFSKTIDVFIRLRPDEMRELLKSGSVAYWQHDLEAAIEAQSGFFMPLRVFIETTTG
jgi:hypothetical protein